VFIAFDRGRHDRCRFLLVVDLERQAVAPVAGPTWLARASEHDARRSLRLHSLIALTPRGLDVVVVHDQGASTDQLGIYTLASGELRSRSVEGKGRLSEGGTVTHMAVTDCAARGSRYVISSGAGFDGTRWRVRRTVFRATESGPLRPIPVFARRASVQRREHIAAQFPEFATGTGPAFRACVVARNSR
jgi:hypothetical protein